MIKLIIFDMDGVLVDSEDAMALMTKKALHDGWGIDCDVEEFRKFRGMGDKVYIGGVAEAHGVPYEEAMKTAAYGLFCENAPRLVRVMDWSVPGIEALEARGFAVTYVKPRKDGNIHIEDISAALQPHRYQGDGPELIRPAQPVDLRPE